MFPIAHAWLLAHVVERPEPAHYLGCIWPDMLFGSPLTHQQSHRSGALLAAHARSLPNSPTADAFRAFVVGALTHGSDPHGFDWYSDEQYGDLPREDRGYAFQRGRSLATAAALACGLGESGAQYGWWKAHNLIEMAFERPLYAATPALGDALTAACADTALHTTIARELERIFDQPAPALASVMLSFPQTVPLHPTTLTALADLYALQTRHKHPGAQPDTAALATLITEAERIIAPDSATYLATCVAHVADMLRATL